MRTDASQRLIVAVLERDAYACQDCGESGRFGRGEHDLIAHHVTPACVGGAHTLENLLTLCNRCHRARHGAGWLKALKPEAYSRGEVFDAVPPAMKLPQSLLAAARRKTKQTGITVPFIVRKALGEWVK